MVGGGSSNSSSTVFLTLVGGDDNEDALLAAAARAPDVLLQVQPGEVAEAHGRHHQQLVAQGGLHAQGLALGAILFAGRGHQFVREIQEADLVVGVDERAQAR